MINLHTEAERLGIPERTLEQVKADLEHAAKRDCGDAMARMMVRYGRLTDDARAYAAAWLEAR
ncbi:hypothetical protein [Mesorhizobium sp. B2-8-9]|uniref:hypothetical protein n=1 Tax=Mesorhizobium sp. B2-8-9 TaxID=2589899 RepID=UPI00112873F4|nr:hypothetical protein [Mesorhizobium sp. B2-8-9]TPI86417.1 hypothetical protein FJ423_00920 [Mesorhizobium sp. B2-8-9]